jgi:raffinose/stachyose/melibiose transport system permease protein
MSNYLAIGRRRLSRSLVFVALAAFAVTILYPFFFMFINSLKTRNDYLTNPFGLPVEGLQWNNYLTMISQFKIFRLFGNTFIIAVSSVVSVIALSIFASYALAKLPFRGSRGTYFAIICTMFVPAQVTMIPMYLMFSKVGLVDNFLSVILCYLAMFLPEAILLMTANFKAIPDEMLEAVELDGAGYFQKVRNVIIPMGMPAIVLCIIFYFIISWNDLFTPMVLLRRMDMRTVMVALATLMARYTGDPPFQFSGLVLSSIPAILVYVFFQKRIIRGLGAGSIK